MANTLKEKKVVFLFGQPGAGKGTQAEILSNKTGYYHLESSGLIEHCFKNEKDDKVFEIEGEKFRVGDEKKMWETGILLSPPFVVSLIREKVKELAEEEKSIIFSGSPRTVYEAEHEFPLIKELYGVENIKFVLLDISADTTMHRNSNRRICELIRHSILFTPETEKLTRCPLDGSKLVRRKGLDEPETIKKRLQEFKERTFPVLEGAEKQGITVHKVNGEQTVDEVHHAILEAIK